MHFTNILSSFFVLWSFRIQVTNGQSRLDIQQWKRETDCMTKECDVLTSLEFVLVELQRIRFETKMARYVAMDTRAAMIEFNRTLSALKMQIIKSQEALENMSEHLYETDSEVHEFFAEEDCNCASQMELPQHKTDKPDDNGGTRTTPDTTAASVNASGEAFKYNMEKSIQDETRNIPSVDTPNSGEKAVIKEAKRLFKDTKGTIPIAPKTDDLTKTVDDLDNAGKELEDTGLDNFLHEPNQVKLREPNYPRATPANILPLPTNLTTGSNFPKDCLDVSKLQTASGVYIISPNGTDELAFPVFCHISDDAWTVFQRRINGKENFYRSWDDYKNGFGDFEGEFWLGNEKLHIITTSGTYKLRIDMWDWDIQNPKELGTHYYAESDFFRVENESQSYKLYVPRDFYAFKGYGGSGLRVHSGEFMTFDHLVPGMRKNCAKLFHCGWWFSTCVRNANLNGKYYFKGYKIPSNKTRSMDDIYWRNIPRSLKKVEMRLKRRE